MDQNSIAAWKQREMDRMADGTYTALPVILDYPAAHFVHLSITASESEHVAYTPSDTYGVADRQVRLKFGRYLRKTFADMTDSDIQACVTRFKSALQVAVSPATLHFATDRTTINRIFETRMTACGSTTTSCMHGKFDGDRIRPYHVYADSPDVAVAYVLTDDCIVSRSVVSVKNKRWIRAYSIAAGDNDADCGTLKNLLENAGYSKGELYGNRLTKLDTSKVMLPYIDNGGCRVRDDDDYWVVVSEGGDYEADNTDGTATELNRCERCDNSQDDCECSYCDCCDESYNAEGCPTCNMCEYCSRCIEHSRCRCSRCSNCNERTDDCECSYCRDCSELEENCECEEPVRDTDETPEPEPAPETRTARELLQAIWSYLLKQKTQGGNDCLRDAAIDDAFQVMRNMRDLVLLEESTTDEVTA